MTKDQLTIWISAARPKTLWAAVAPVLVGSALAYHDGGFHLPSALLALLGAVLIQIGTNFANDYYDYFHGADRGERLGPTRATQAGLVKPEQMKRAMLLVFALAVLAGLYLIRRGGWPILLIGVLSILFGMLYTAGPYPLSYLGISDLFVLIFFGLVAVGGTYYVQTLRLSANAVIAGLAPGLFSTAILVVNNLRDVNNDRAAGKKTLAVRFGETFARWEYLLCLLLGSLVPVYQFLFTGAPAAVLVSSLVFLLTLPSIRFIFTQPPGREYNRILALTGRNLFLFSLLYSLGWLL